MTATAPIPVASVSFPPNSIVYERDLTKAEQLQSEIDLIEELVNNVITSKMVQAQGSITLGVKVTKIDLLEGLKSFSGVDGKNIDQLNACLQLMEFVMNIYKDDNVQMDDLIINTIVPDLPPGFFITPKLVSMYFQTMHGFTEEALEPIDQNLDCFCYVIKKCGLDINELAKFSISSPDGGEHPLLHYYLQFLNEKGFRQAAMPMQENDIVLYAKDGAIAHAALVANVTDLVYAKFGRMQVFKHPHEKTLPMYGSSFQIYRRSNAAA